MTPTVVFAANYINHHQIPFCEALLGRVGEDFTFVQLEEMEQERLNMGWQDRSEELPWVLKWSSDRKEAEREILSCDLFLCGWAPQVQHLIARRMQLHRPVFQISERIYKDGQWKAISPRGLVDKYKTFTRFRKDPYFLLCAGAYVGSDYGIIHAFPDKKYRWGYFPPMRVYEGERPPIRRRGAADTAELIWAGRFVDFKHVERVLSLAARLQQGGKRFCLHIAGDGDRETADKAHRFVEQNGLEEVVIFHGFQSPDAVRELMESCDIFVLTSDHGEGWGAVLNEAMNSGCAPVAGAQAGAVPYLIQNSINGYVYADGDENDLVWKVERLIDDTELCERFAELSYRRIRSLWNAEVAAERFLDFGESVLELCEKRRRKALRGEKVSALDIQRLDRELPAEGPMSKDPCLKPFLSVPRMADKSGSLVGELLQEEDE